jgi:hypothetical protein
MDGFRNLLRWPIEHWKSWGVYAILLGVSNFGTWILSRRKDWAEWRVSRQAKADKKVDDKVLQALGNFTLWGYQRSMTGSGIPYVRASEIAEHLSLDSDTVSDSLERLEARGRVERSSGTYDNPTPTWRIVPR